MQRLILAALLAVCGTAFAQKTAPDALAELRIPHHKFVLDNGLTVVVSPDASASAMC